MFAANPTLVLNADFQPLSYFPLSLFNWEDAVKAVVKGSHVVVAEYDQLIRSPSTVMRLPSVIALRAYVRPPARVAFTRFNVFLRDRFRCQYCGDQHLRGELTFDHVMPRADGGQTSWTNIVAACSLATRARTASTSSRCGSRSSRRSTISWPPSVCSRRTFCTRPGATICTGTSSSRSNGAGGEFRPPASIAT